MEGQKVTAVIVRKNKMKRQMKRPSPMLLPKEKEKFRKKHKSAGNGGVTYATFQGLLTSSLSPATAAQLLNSGEAALPIEDQLRKKLADVQAAKDRDARSYQQQIETLKTKVEHLTAENKILREELSRRPISEPASSIKSPEAPEPPAPLPPEPTENMPKTLIKPCKCGSTTHSRTTSSECPLRKQRPTEVEKLDPTINSASQQQGKESSKANGKATPTSSTPSNATSPRSDHKPDYKTNAQSTTPDPENMGTIGRAASTDSGKTTGKKERRGQSVSSVNGGLEFVRKPCKCGSLTHSRTTNSECPLRKPKSTPGPLASVPETAKKNVVEGSNDTDYPAHLQASSQPSLQTQSQSTTQTGSSAASKKTPKPCKCGSTTHSRTTNSECPLRKQPTTPVSSSAIAAASVLDGTSLAENSFMAGDMWKKPCKCGSTTHSRTTSSECPLRKTKAEKSATLAAARKKAETASPPAFIPKATDQTETKSNQEEDSAMNASGIETEISEDDAKEDTLTDEALKQEVLDGKKGSEQDATNKKDNEEEESSEENKEEGEQKGELDAQEVVKEASTETGEDQVPMDVDIQDSKKDGAEQMHVDEKDPAKTEVSTEDKMEVDAKIFDQAVQNPEVKPDHSTENTDHTENNLKDEDKEEGKKEEVNKKEVKKEEVKKEEADKKEAKKEEADKNEAKKEEADKNEAKKEEADKKEAKKEEVKKEEVKKDKVKKVEADKKEAKKDKVKKVEVSKAESRVEEVNKENVVREEEKKIEIKKDKAKKDKVKKEEIKKEKAKKDENKKEGGKKDEGKKEESKKEEGKKDKARKDDGKKDKGRKEDGKKDRVKKEEKKEKLRREEGKKDRVRKEDGKKEEGKKDKVKREEGKKDDSKREESKKEKKREEGKRDDNKREEGKKDKAKSKSKDGKREESKKDKVKRDDGKKEKSKKDKKDKIRKEEKKEKSKKEESKHDKVRKEECKKEDGKQPQGETKKDEDRKEGNKTEDAKKDEMQIDETNKRETVLESKVDNDKDTSDFHNPTASSNMPTKIETLSHNPPNSDTSDKPLSNTPLTLDTPMDTQSAHGKDAVENNEEHPAKRVKLSP
eukprot:m.151899 g.151899  ORF g.151899 m.151899 type:complete len:1089 (+) comp15047_c0_seq6:277-3543(+)